MTFMEIALLVIGVIIFVISFLLPEGNEQKSEKVIESQKEEVHRLIEAEIDGMKYKVNEVTNDTVDNAVDRAERSLEKVSNEKIMAVNEYAGTVIEEINKNHKEVMFLYDMIKDKQTDLTNVVRKADATVKEIEQVSHTAQAASETLLRGMSVATVSQKGLTDEQKAVFDDVFIPDSQGQVRYENRELISPQENATTGLVKKNSNAGVLNNEVVNKKALFKGKKGAALTQSKIFADLANLNDENDEFATLQVQKAEEKVHPDSDIISNELDGVGEQMPDAATQTDVADVTDYSEVENSYVEREPVVKQKVAIDVLSGTAFREGNSVNADTSTGRVVTAADFAAMVNGTSNRGIDRNESAGKVMTQAPANNNDKIIEMSKQGMSKVEIAKALGLGVGEVKLVIDLFR